MEGPNPGSKGDFKKKALVFAVQFLVIVAGALTAQWAYQQLNKPRVMPPDSSKTA